MTNHDLATDPSTVVTPDHLAWWHDLAPTLQWRFAKTMAQYPHSYIHASDQNHLRTAVFLQAARVIETFGRPARFRNKPKIYLDSPDESTRYWIELEPGTTVHDVRLVNRAPNGQNEDWDTSPEPIPSTDTREFTTYDRFAVEYDHMYEDPADLEENASLRRLITSQLGTYSAPITLDVGCGTGLTLDLGITSPVLYTGIDPSKGMLNQLYRKHPRVEQIMPGTATETLPQVLEEKGPASFDLVLSTFGSASYLNEEDFRNMVKLTEPGGLLLAMTYENGYAPAYYEGEDRGNILERSGSLNLWLSGSFMSRHNVTRTRIGRFLVWMVTP